MKYTIDALSSDEVTLTSSRGKRIYTNSMSGRKHLSDALANNSDQLNQIFAEWGEQPTVSETKLSDLIPLDAARTYKRNLIKTTCRDQITNGVDVDCGLINDDGTSRGCLHYTLTDRNQQDLKELADAVAQGATRVTYRDASRVSHEVYTAEQFNLLYDSVRRFILKCKLKSDALETVLDRAVTFEDVCKITWNVEIPEDIQTEMDSLYRVTYPDGE